MAGTRQINQLLPSYSRGDAIGNEAYELRRLFRSWGYASDIFVEHPQPGIFADSKTYDRYAAVSSPDSILLYHHSIGSDLSRFIRTLPDIKVLMYHNITPYEWYIGINDYLAALLKTGREELDELKDVIDLALADSEYNRAELAHIGYARTAVTPLFVDFSGYDKTPDRDVMRVMGDGRTNILFVGRVTPNKCHDDLIKTFYCYKKYFDADARLIMVGSFKGTERYAAHIKRLIEELDLKDAILTGPVSMPELIAYYKTASIFLSLSEHEGFCVPLVESMYFDIPVIAYNAAAVPGTLGGAGILLGEKSFLETAGLIDVMVKDETLRQKVLISQRERLNAFASERSAELLKKYLEELGI